MKKDLSKCIDQLNDLYKMIPAFDCVRSCTDCCGPTFMSGLERYLIEKEEVINSTSCPWRGKGNCTIYDHRPIICRLFGTVNDKRLMCSFGKGPALLIDGRTANNILIKSFNISAEAGFPDMHQTHGGFFESLVSPSKKTIKLDGYFFNDK